MTISSDNSNVTLKNTAIGTAAVVAGWEGQTYLSKAAKYPFQKYLGSKIPSIRGGGFLPYVNTALRQNHLENKIKIVDLNQNNAITVSNRLGIKLKSDNIITKIIKHVFRLPSKENSFMRTVNGCNAFFYPKKNAVVCNFDKFGAPIFHELQHKLNSTSSNILIKALVKLKHPLAIFGTMGISACSLLTNETKDGEKENVAQKIKNNCGLLALACMLPHTAEEFIANIKGTDIAKKAGVAGEMLKKVKSAHKISMISYGAVALITAFSVWGGNKIRDIICRQKIDKNNIQNTKPKQPNYIA